MKIVWDYPDNDEDQLLEIHDDSAEEIEYDNGKDEEQHEFGELRLQYHEDEDEDGEMKTWWRGYDTGDCTCTEWCACRQSTILLMIDRAAELEDQ